MLGNMTCTLGTTLSKMLSNTYSLLSNIYTPRIQHIYPTYTWNCYPTYISPCYPTYITCPDYTCCPTYMISYMLGNISGALYMLGNISYMLDYMWPNIYTCYPTYIGNRKMHPTYTSNIYIQHIYEGIYVGYMCWVYVLGNISYMLDYITQYICWVTWGFVDEWTKKTFPSHLGRFVINRLDTSDKMYSWIVRWLPHCRGRVEVQIKSLEKQQKTLEKRNVILEFYVSQSNSRRTPR